VKLSPQIIIQNKIFNEVAIKQGTSALIK